MNCTTLHDLVEHFVSQVESLKLKVDLRDVAEQDMCHSVLSSLHNEVNGLSVVLALIRAEVAKQKDQLKTCEVMKKSVQELNARLRYLLDNIPARLPNKQEQSPPVISQTQVEPRQEVRSQAAVNVHVPPKAKPKPAIYVQQLDLLTVDEFESAPKYMRGRLTYDHINNTVDELNKALTAKYKIMGQKKTKLSEAKREKWEMYKSQENKDSAGYYFIVDADIKACTSLKIDNAFRSIITILRHCGRIKEIRGGGLVRYAVLVVY